MKQLRVTLFLSIIITQFSTAQDTVFITLPDTTITNFRPSKFAGSPYTTKFKVDAPIIIAGVGVTYLGTTLIKNKAVLTPAQVATKTHDKIPGFDRGNAGFYSEKADKDSYLPFQASFAMPLITMLLNKNERRNASQVLVLYVETMSITGSLFTIAAGVFDKSRPLVYSNENGISKAPADQRQNKNNQRSFFAGHTAASAAATFFTAKVFSDMNPNSKLKPYLWIGAAAVPALVGYLRYKAGMHFLSDNLLGYAIGAGAGILIPELHKNKRMKNLSFVPEVGDGYKGVAFAYRF